MAMVMSSAILGCHGVCLLPCHQSEILRLVNRADDRLMALLGSAVGALLTNGSRSGTLSMVLDLSLNAGAPQYQISLALSLVLLLCRTFFAALSCSTRVKA